MKVFAMIPARMGSQRLKKKNLQPINGVPLITHAVRKAKAAGVFDEIWVNSEHEDFGVIAADEGVGFHKRPEELANDKATSEDFVYEFFKKHDCDYIVQVHSIAPLLTVEDTVRFVNALREKRPDVMLSVENVQIECAIEGKPVNFTYSAKTNSQELTPVQRVTWSITAWRKETYVKAYESGKCATYSGEVIYYPINKMASHIIKTQEDLDIAEALWPLTHR